MGGGDKNNNQLVATWYCCNDVQVKNTRQKSACVCGGNAGTWYRLSAKVVTATIVTLQKNIGCASHFTTVTVSF